MLDAAEGAFAADVQKRIWAVAEAAGHIAGVRETVPGMNNLLVAFDALAVTPDTVETTLRTLWREIVPGEVAGKTVEVPVVYGGEDGEDLVDWAQHCGLPVDEAIGRHAAVTYSVAAIGAMPGFPYLSGLDPSLARGRRAVPRSRVIEGAVIIGGAQAGIMPQTAPSGWHIIGHTALRLFDPSADPPALLQPGDRVRFVVAGTAT